MNLDVPSSSANESVAISLEESSETEIGSPSFATSRLLCPSNLGALLESTTSTLVSGGWKDPVVGVSMNSCEDVRVESQKMEELCDNKQQ